jgi:hypothetical protein
MRFLILRRNISESWQFKNKNYHVYRLHYFDSDNIFQDEHKLALSYFIGPNETPTSDVVQLKARLNNTEELTLLAQHASTSGNKYEELHEYFRVWFNNLLTTETLPELSDDDNYLAEYWWLLIILVIVILVYRNKKIIRKVNFFWNQNVKIPLRRNIFLPPEPTITTNSYTNEIDSLQVELRQLRIRIHKLEEQLKETAPDSKQIIETEVKSFINGQFNDDVNKTLESYANQFWQEFINSKEKPPESDTSQIESKTL